MPRSNSESGNVFMFIMLGIALFAALMFTFSRGAHEGGGRLSKKQAEMAAMDIIAYANKLERAVARVQQKGISENDISFDNAFVSGYDNASCTTNTCKVFSTGGGNITYQRPSDSVNDGSDWVITGANYVKGMGAIGDETDAELTLVLPNVTETICSQINNELGIDGIPQEFQDSATTPFQGTFSSTPELIEENGGTALDGVSSACFEGDNTPASGTYHFYHVLVKRP